MLAAGHRTSPTQLVTKMDRERGTRAPCSYVVDKADKRLVSPWSSSEIGFPGLEHCRIHYLDDLCWMLHTVSEGLAVFVGVWCRDLVRGET
jgi:hypothetical protein